MKEEHILNGKWTTGKKPSTQIDMAELIKTALGKPLNYEYSAVGLIWIDTEGLTTEEKAVLKAALESAGVV